MRRRDRRRAARVAPAASEPRPASGAWRSRRVLGALLAAAVAAASYLAWRARSPSRRPHVLLVTIDTLRADRVGCYGAGPGRTPVLDALAARGARAATAVAHTPLTAPSHASLLTGRIPPRHGVRDNGRFVLPAGVPTLAESLRQAGYRTAAFVSGFPLDRRYGFARGFEHYDDRLPRGQDPRRAAYVERPADATSAALLRWLDSRTGAAEPFFVWLHYFDPHAPYEPPEPFRTRFAQAPYDGEAAFVDAQLGLVFERLRARGELEHTLVLVTADHGESLGEHGEPTHGLFIYDATVRVPWIVAGPGIPSGRVTPAVARGIDATPTLLDLAGLPPLSGADGRSLRPELEGRTLNDAPAYLESLFAHLHLGFAPLHGWRRARDKFVLAPEPEFYDLAADPGEALNLHGRDPSRAADSEQALRKALAAPAEVAAAAPRDADAAERLRALGYLGGSARPAPASGPARDPKAGLRLALWVEQGLAEARTRPESALRALDAALREEPRLPLALRYRAIAHTQLQRHAAALADLEALERLGALAAEDWVLRAECLRLAGRATAALAALERAQALDPHAPEPGLTRARILAGQGRLDEAAAAYEDVLRLQPEQVAALSGAAELALVRGELGRAVELLGRLRGLQPDDARVPTRLGMALARGGRLEEAAGAFQEALSLAPDEHEALLGLGGVLAKAGQPQRALPYFERAVELGASSPAAWNGLGFARLESGDPAGAVAALRASLRADPRQAGVAETVARLERERTRAGGPP